MSPVRPPVVKDLATQHTGVGPRVGQHVNLHVSLGEGQVTEVAVAQVTSYIYTIHLFFFLFFFLFPPSPVIHQVFRRFYFVRSLQTKAYSETSRHRVEVLGALFTTLRLENSCLARCGSFNVIPRGLQTKQRVSFESASTKDGHLSFELA